MRAGARPPTVCERRKTCVRSESRNRVGDSTRFAPPRSRAQQRHLRTGARSRARFVNCPLLLAPVSDFDDALCGRPRASPGLPTFGEPSTLLSMTSEASSARLGEKRPTNEHRRGSGAPLRPTLPLDLFPLGRTPSDLCLRRSRRRSVCRSNKCALVIPTYSEELAREHGFLDFGLPRVRLSIRFAGKQPHIASKPVPLEYLQSPILPTRCLLPPVRRAKSLACGLPSHSPAASCTGQSLDRPVVAACSHLILCGLARYQCHRNACLRFSARYPLPGRTDLERPARCWFSRERFEIQRVLSRGEIPRTPPRDQGRNPAAHKDENPLFLRPSRARKCHEVDSSDGAYGE